MLKANQQWRINAHGQRRDRVIFRALNSMCGHLDHNRSATVAASGILMKSCSAAIVWDVQGINALEDELAVRIRAVNAG